MPHTLATAAQAMALPASAGWMALLALLAVAAIGYAAWRNQRARAAAQRLLAEAQRETARREQEFSLLIQGVQELIFRTDAQGNIRFANPRCLFMLPPRAMCCPLAYRPCTSTLAPSLSPPPLFPMPNHRCPPFFSSCRCRRPLVLFCGPRPCSARFFSRLVMTLS